LNFTEKFTVPRPAFALSFEAMLDILIIVVVLLVVFGAGKLRNTGSDLGAAVKSFRKALHAPPPQRPASDPEGRSDRANPPGTLPDAEFPEVLAARSRGSGKSDA
jgi:sec-independent protein translocase protein TatA